MTTRTDNRVRLDRQAIFKDVQDWLLHDYLPKWTSAGKEGSKPDFINRYWGAPLWMSTPEFGAVLLPTQADVISRLDSTHTRLHKAGYTHTYVPDYRITPFNATSAALDAIWSRRRADESQIERLAVNFEMLRTDRGWRVVVINTLWTDADRIVDLWPAYYLNGEERHSTV